jgi:hypothetical protein
MVCERERERVRAKILKEPRFAIIFSVNGDDHE